MESLLRDFTKHLLVYFGLSDFKDFTRALIKLCQTSIIREYQPKFEELVNCMEGLVEAFFKICFIIGLKEEIFVEVKIFNPDKMMATIGLVKLAKDKFIAK